MIVHWASHRKDDRIKVVERISPGGFKSCVAVSGEDASA
jgi:hypothetical protein